MDRDEHRGCRVQRPHRQVTKLRRAIDNNDVVVIGNLVDGAGDASEEQVMAAFAPLDDCARRMVLELHEFKVARNKPYSVKIGRPDNFTHRAATFVIPNCTVQRFVLSDIEFGLVAEHCGQRSLRIEVNCEDSKTRKGEILRKGHCRCRLGGSALEVRDGYDLKFVAGAAAGGIFEGVSLAPSWECTAELLYLCLSLR